VIQITVTNYSVCSQLHKFFSEFDRKKIRKATQINQPLSKHRVTKQYQIRVQFNLILSKQYAYVGA